MDEATKPQKVSKAHSQGIMSILLVGGLCWAFNSFLNITGTSSAVVWDSVAKESTTTSALPVPVHNSLVMHLLPEEPDRNIIKLLNDTMKNPIPLTVSTCSPTCQVKIVISHDNAWYIHALDENGNEKQVGGDEFFVSYYDYYDQNDTHIREIKQQPDFVAFVQDHNNGIYTLEFSSIPFGGPDESKSRSGRGTVKVDFIYTCGMGVMARPSKDHWKNGGYLASSYVYHNISMPKFHKYSLPLAPLYDLSQYDRLICFGDSLNGNFCGSAWDVFFFRAPNIVSKGNHGGLIRSDTLHLAFEKLEEFHNASLNEANSSKVGLLLSSAAWEMSSNDGLIEDEFFNLSLGKYRTLVETARARYPNVNVIWLSPKAVHLTVLKESCWKKRACVDRTRYISNKRAEYLYTSQKQIMTELGVPFLDLWNITYLSPSWHMDGDCQHYRKWLDKFLLERFYPDGWVVLTRR